MKNSTLISFLKCAMAILAAAFPVAVMAASPNRPIMNLVFERPKAPSAAPKLGGTLLKLSLRESITLALARNFDIAIEAHNPHIRQNELREKKSVFDPALTSGANTRKDRTDTPSGLFAGGGQQEVSEQTLSAGVVKKTVTGADISLIFKTAREHSNSRQKFINPDFDSSLTLSISQPLLKNFGIDVNKADIRIASFSLDQSLLSYRNRVISVIDSVEQAYWDLFFSVSNIEFRKKSLELAKDLLRRNRIQVEVGTLAPIEILEALATVAAREEEVIVAERILQDREDALKKLINVSGSISSWALRVSPTDRPSFSPFKVDEIKSTLRALKRRADLENARLEIEKRKIRLKKYKRNLLPQLDLSASASNQGVNNSFSKSIDRQTGNKGYTFSGGINLKFPIGNHEAKAKYGQSRVQLQKARTAFNQLEQSVIEEVRRSVRRVRTDTKRIQASRLASRLAEKRLNSQEKKFEVGLSTSRDVLEDQAKVANALTNEVQALVDYKKSLAQLSRVTYTTLNRFKIKLGNPLKGGQGKTP